MKIIITVTLTALCMYTIQAQSTLSDKDKKFITEAAQGGLMEVKTG